MIDYRALAIMPDADVLDLLTQINCIGCWMAKGSFLKALGRADEFLTR